MPPAAQSTLVLCLQGDLAALLSLIGALNAWQNESRLASQQAESALEMVPMQVSMLLECGISLELKQASQEVWSCTQPCFACSACQCLLQVQVSLSVAACDNTDAPWG